MTNKITFEERQRVWPHLRKECFSLKESQNTVQEEMVIPSSLENE